MSSSLIKQNISETEIILFTPLTFFSDEQVPYQVFRYYFRLVYGSFDK